MPGDAALTRRRILDAAVREFADYGIAGARIDRIADSAASNKAMLYRYFGSKSGLFDAVFDDVVVRTVSDVPIDGDDLPGYAVRLWDRHRTDPNPLRIGAWDELERGGAGSRTDAVRIANEHKIEVVADAQRRGTVDGALDAAALLRCIIALSRIAVGETMTARAAKAPREAVRSAAAKLVAPATSRTSRRVVTNAPSGRPSGDHSRRK